MVTADWLADLRLGAFRRDYADPSTLEQDQRDLTAGAFLRAPPSSPTRGAWVSAGLARTYPDTTAVDRDIVGLEGELETLARAGARAAQLPPQRTAARQRRHCATLVLAALERSPACGSAAGPASGARRPERDRAYDYETTAYFDSWRVRGVLDYRAASPLSAIWLVGVAAEKLAAATAPRPTTRSACGSDSSPSRPISAAAPPSNTATATTGRTAEASGADFADFASYSDFNYWELWIVGTWHLTGAFSLDLMASYHPEKHTERIDDAALGFASLRLVWRR